MSRKTCAALARVSSDPYTGLARQSPRSSANVLEALNSIARYLCLHCPALHLKIDIESEIHNGLAVMVFDIRDATIKRTDQSYELSLANGMQILKLLGAGRLQPQRIYFKHQQLSSSRAYQDTFGCDVYFDQPWCGVFLPIEGLTHSLSSADYQTWQLAERYLESRFVPNTSSISLQVTELIRSLLPTHQCNSATIAEQLSMHKRTLQRRLLKEGVSYEKLLDSERRDQAQKYLRQADMRFDHIAGLLGYSEQSVFNRACRKWFGKTPSVYRRELHRED